MAGWMHRVHVEKNEKKKRNSVRELMEQKITSDSLEQGKESVLDLAQAVQQLDKQLD